MGAWLTLTLYLALRPSGKKFARGFPTLRGDQGLARRVGGGLQDPPPLWRDYRTGGDRLFRRGDLPRIVFDALRENPEGLNVDQLAAIAMQDEGIDESDPELTATVRQRCMMAMYRYLDKGVIVKERRGSVRVWRLVT